MKSFLFALFITNIFSFNSYAQVVVGGCSYPEVVLETHSHGKTFFRLRPGTKILTQMQYDYTLRSYEDIFNFQVDESRTGSDKKCAFWTNMLKDRVIHVLNACGDTWTLKSEKFNHWHPISVLRGKNFTYKFEGCWLNL